jgi:3-methyladenine DNA glycosylase/8-oxoguanine DNA glycosylase
MMIELDVSLDHTLGCGQAHRWFRKDGKWEGVIDGRIVTLEQLDNGFECSGIDDKRILEYFRSDDDIPYIYSEISKDDRVASLVKKFHGLRILKQEPWECTASYLLATNANVKRIGMMIDSVCREFGRDLDGRYSFPDPEDILRCPDNVCKCRLGFRDKRLVWLAAKVADNELDLNDLKTASYEECIETLKEVNGIGDKVADCIALFAYGHLDAVPIDARIKKRLSEYGIEGNYKMMSSAARERFGPFAGYAQQFLYHGSI